MMQAKPYPGLSVTRLYTGVAEGENWDPHCVLQVDENDNTTAVSDNL